MNPGKIDGANHDFGAPPDWNPQTQGNCATLPVRNDGASLASAWYPSPEEMEAMRQGCPVILTILGQRHPVVMLGVAAIPGAAEPMCFHGNTARAGCPECEAEEKGLPLPERPAPKLIIPNAPLRRKQ